MEGILQEHIQGEYVPIENMQIIGTLHPFPQVSHQQSAIDAQLRDLAQRTSPSLAKYVIALIDEMYVKEGL